MSNFKYRFSITHVCGDSVGWPTTATFLLLKKDRSFQLFAYLAKYQSSNNHEDSWNHLTKKGMSR